MLRRGVARRLLAALFGPTGAQLALRDPGQLLLLMAHPRSVFSRGLAAFSRRSLYANAAGDRTVPFWTAFVSSWAEGGEPLPPPEPLPAGGAGSAGGADYPHVQWEGIVGGSDAGSGSSQQSSSASHSLLDSADGTLPPSSVDGEAPRSIPWPAGAAGAAPDSAPKRGVSDRLSLPNRILLFAALPLALPLFAFVWLFVALPSLLLTGWLKHGAASTTLPRRMTALQVGEEGGAASWKAALADESDELAAARADPQAWMAARLNDHPWHKVVVRFSLSQDGLAALHTHGAIVVRRAYWHAAGADVVAHAADALLQPHEWCDFAVRIAALHRKR